MRSVRKYGRGLLKQKTKKSKLKTNEFVTKMAERDALSAGNNIISKFMKEKFFAYHKQTNNLLPVYAKCLHKIQTVKPTTMLIEIRKISKEQSIAQALVKAVSKSNPIPLWNELVKTIQWLNDKNK